MDPTEALAPSEEPSLFYGPDVGAALKAAREFRGLSLQDVSDATRIRRTYLGAIEDMRLEELPSRPFTLGYIKAYAKHLDLDPEEAVNRFKDVSPDPDEPLRAPVGVRRERDPRMGAIVATGVLIVVAIVLWNIAQRAINDDAPPPPTAPETVGGATPVDPTGTMAVGAPLPAPVEASTPAVYKTPGLEASAAADGSADAVSAASKLRRAAEAAAPDAEPPLNAGAAFIASGAVHGADAGVSTVTFQARKATTLIVRGSDGSVYFARALAAGDAYRAPAIKGLAVEVPDPSAMNVFVANKLKGPMTSTTATVASLID
ncbi:MAG: helix-turn-helix domain-containing protein [Caulobacter sp.]|nr:helix-turn-helix domain-containing protein [Caulobacter sp.]